MSLLKILYLVYKLDENEKIIHRPVLYTIEFNGTTNIGDKLYNNVYRTNYDEQCNPQEPYLVAYVKEENKNIGFDRHDIFTAN